MSNPVVIVDGVPDADALADALRRAVMLGAAHWAGRDPALARRLSRLLAAMPARPGRER